MTTSDTALTSTPFGLGKPFALALALFALSAMLVLPFPLPLPVVAATAHLAVVLALLIAYDATELRLPDKLTLPLAGAGLVFHAAYSWPDFGWYAAGAVAGYAVLTAVGVAFLRVRGIAGLGRGDAKLFAAAGAWTGLASLPGVLLAASLAALVTIGAVAVAGRRIGAHERIPFGPFLALGLWAAWIAGPLV